MAFKRNMKQMRALWAAMAVVGCAGGMVTHMRRPRPA